MEKKILDGMGSQGVCPVCGSTDLDYASLEIDDCGVHYPTTCNNCSTTFNECYNLAFDGHYNIQEACGE